MNKPKIIEDDSIDLENKFDFVDECITNPVPHSSIIQTMLPKNKSHNVLIKYLFYNAKEAVYENFIFPIF